MLKHFICDGSIYGDKTCKYIWRIRIEVGFGFSFQRSFAAIISIERTKERKIK